MKEEINKRTITRDEFYVLNPSGRIDLKRSPKDYLDLRDELQRHTNGTDDPFPIHMENHVKALVRDSFESMRNNLDKDEAIIREVKIGELSIFFTFGLPPQAQSVTIKN